MESNKNNSIESNTPEPNIWTKITNRLLHRHSEELGIAKDLTPKQKRKYIFQYLKIIFWNGIVILVMGVGIIQTGLLLYNNKQGFFFFLSLLITQAYVLSKIGEQTADQIELIAERIRKRSQRNTKQQRKTR